MSAAIHCLKSVLGRGARLDIAKDFNDLVGAQTFAESVIQQATANERADQFWHEVAVGSVTGVTTAFILNAPGNWRLGDIVRAFNNEKTLRAVLKSHPQAKPYLALLGSDRTAANVISSVCSHMLKFRPLAGLSEHAVSSVSLTDFLKGGSIFVLGENETARMTMRALNRVILTRLSQMLLQEEDHLAPRTFVVIDELSSIQFEELDELIVKGRSKGVCFIGAFQSIQGLYRRYGKEIADSLLGQIRFKAFLKLSCPVTAEWASSVIGDQEQKRTQATTKFNAGAAGHVVWSDRTGGSETIQQTRLVMPSEFTSMKEVNPPDNQGITGFYVASSEIFKDYSAWPKIKSQLHPRNEYVKDNDYLPDSCQMLPPWTEEDWLRLGLDPNIMRRIEEENDDDPSAGSASPMPPYSPIF